MDPILDYQGDEPASSFYHEGVKRVWFCFSLTPEARAGLGPTALSLAGTPEADRMAFQRLLDEAVDGDPLAMYQVGLLTLVGCGTSEDVDGGFAWLERAAELDLPEAQYALGDLYARGELVTGDMAEALDYFDLAADKNFHDAHERIEELLEVVGILEAHADEGHADAQFRLGLLTWFGKAVERDEERGLALLEAAAAQGHEEAQEHLYFASEVLPALRRQAAGGEPEAQFELARQLLLDEALPQDLPEAIAWLKRAARQGHREACIFLGNATAWTGGHGLLDELREAAENGEAWAIAALDHLPASLDD